MPGAGIPGPATGRHLGPARGSSREPGTARRRDQDAAPPPRRTSHSQGPGDQCGLIVLQPLAERTRPPGLGSGRSSGRFWREGQAAKTSQGSNTRGGCEVAEGPRAGARAWWPGGRGLDTDTSPSAADFGSCGTGAGSGPVVDAEASPWRPRTALLRPWSPPDSAELPPGLWLQEGQVSQATRGRATGPSPGSPAARGPWQVSVAEPVIHAPRVPPLMHTGGPRTGGE